MSKRSSSGRVLPPLKDSITTTNKRPIEEPKPAEVTKDDFIQQQQDLDSEQFLEIKAQKLQDVVEFQQKFLGFLQEHTADNKQLQTEAHELFIKIYAQALSYSFKDFTLIQSLPSLVTQVAQFGLTVDDFQDDQLALLNYVKKEIRPLEWEIYSFFIALPLEVSGQLEELLQQVTRQMFGRGGVKVGSQDSKRPTSSRRSSQTPDMGRQLLGRWFYLCFASALFDLEFEEGEVLGEWGLGQ